MIYIIIFLIIIGVIYRINSIDERIKKIESKANHDEHDDVIIKMLSKKGKKVKIDKKTGRIDIVATFMDGKNKEDNNNNIK